MRAPQIKAKDNAIHDPLFKDKKKLIIDNKNTIYHMMEDQLKRLYSITQIVITIINDKYIPYSLLKDKKLDILPCPKINFS